MRVQLSTRAWEVVARKYGPPPLARDVKQEPMLFKADTAFASKHGGPLTRHAIGMIERCGVLPISEMGRLRIDTRSHMLMPGWYPCIPGWHCDFKNVADDGTQIHDLERDHAVKHFMFVSDEPTAEFCPGVEVLVDRLTWGEVDREVPARKGFWTPKPGEMVLFDSNTLHRGVPHRGAPGHWRWFFRASLFPKGDPQEHYRNEIRTQVQVYCDVNAGW